MRAHIISALYTFITGFLIVVIPAVTELSLEEIQSGALTGVLLAGIRFGLKALGQELLNLK